MDNSGYAVQVGRPVHAARIYKLHCKTLPSELGIAAVSGEPGSRIYQCISCSGKPVKKCRFPHVWASYQCNLWYYFFVFELIIHIIVVKLDDFKRSHRATPGNDYWKSSKRTRGAVILRVVQ